MNIQSQIDDLRRRATDSYGGFLPAKKCGETADTMQLMNAVYKAAKMLCNHVHIAPTTEHMVRPDHQAKLEQALAALEKSSEGRDK